MADHTSASSGPQFGRVLGIDIGGTKIAAGVVDDRHRVVARDRVPTPRTGGPDVMVAVESLVRSLADRAGPVDRIGVGAPGVIDPDTGRVLSATEVLPGWTGTRVGPDLRGSTGLPVAVANDVRMAALGEAVAGAGAGIDRLLVVSLGTGVGGGFVFGGSVERGSHGTAGEIAHLLTPSDGPVACGCGRRDHLEAHACGPAIVAAYQQATGGEDDLVDLPTIARRAEADDAAAVEVLARAGRIAGRALAGLVAAVDVDAVVVTGGVVGVGELLLSDLRAAFSSEAIAPVRDIPIVSSTLGGDAPVVGAAHLARTVDRSGGVRP